MLYIEMEIKRSLREFSQPNKVVLTLLSQITDTNNDYQILLLGQINQVTTVSSILSGDSKSIKNA